MENFIVSVNGKQICKNKQVLLHKIFHHDFLSLKNIS